MKNSVLLALLLSASVGTAFAQRDVRRGIPIDRQAYIKVYLLHGSVHVVGWDRDSLAVTGTVEKGSLFFGGSGGSAKLGVWEEKGFEAGTARLEVRVPAASTIWIKSESADVSVSGVTGGLDVYSVTGAVRIEGSLRQLYAESMGGRLDVAASAPSVRLKTAGGAIAFRGGGEDVTISTVSGRIDATAGRPLRARLETVTGDIHFAGGVERGGSLTFQTHSGAVNLGLPSGLDAEISVATFQGDITNGLDPRKTADRDLRGREVSFLSGRGGAQIWVRTFSGDVILRAR
ncbi:DUF4097 family beta strand repeat-containing protein [soil metagenome]